jgi:hypothetical protein
MPAAGSATAINKAKEGEKRQKTVKESAYEPLVPAPRSRRPDDRLAEKSNLRYPYVMTWRSHRSIHIVLAFRGQKSQTNALPTALSIA